MQLFDDHGKRLNAKYEAQAEGTGIAITMQSRSGSSDARDARNPEYNAALEVLLSRLGQLGDSTGRRAGRLRIRPSSSGFRKPTAGSSAHLSSSRTWMI